MCKAMDDLRNEAMEIGRAIGRAEALAECHAEGRTSALLEIVQNLKKRMGFTDQQVKEVLCISDEEWSKIMAMV